MRQIYLDNSTSAWKSGEMLPTRSPFIWYYKTTFQAPLGSEPVVVDLLGMNKGAARVNGKSIGRFWPNYTVSLGGCHPCDYRASFKSDSYQTGSGEPAQRCDEAGGDPSMVNFQTVTVGTICAKVAEGKNMNLSCQGTRQITAIQFASYGDPKGDCGSFQVGDCDADGVLNVVQKECVGQQTCSIAVNEETLGAGQKDHGRSSYMSLKPSIY